MALHRLKIPSELSRFVSSLPPTLKKKIRGGLDALLENYQTGKPLRAELTGLWSLRVGYFRIIYRPSEGILEVIAIGPRKTIYQNVPNMVNKES